MGMYCKLNKLQFCMKCSLIVPTFFYCVTQDKFVSILCFCFIFVLLKYFLKACQINSVKYLYVLWPLQYFSFMFMIYCISLPTDNYKATNTGEKKCNLRDKCNTNLEKESKKKSKLFSRRFWSVGHKCSFSAHGNTRKHTHKYTRAHTHTAL